VIALVALTALGCAHSRRNDFWAQHIGIRPDEPKIPPAATMACDVYIEYAAYAQQLQEAYHSRATQNRFWIYAAGIVGLGAAAASGGLAAAAAAATTIGLVSISGGFAAGTFAAINNSELANVYTIAANRIDTVVIDAERLRRASASAEAGCTAAFGVLRESVSETRMMLEQARTNNALGALIRAKEEQKALARVLETVEDANPTRITVSASIPDIDTSAFPRVVLTVENIQLDRVAQADVKAVLGAEPPIDVSEVRKGSKEFTYLVTFQAPSTPPVSGQASYPVSLLVGRSRQRVVSTRTLTYP
jgi:hypothetical protein